jgi:tRNA G10  N-methylase Trm11
MTARAETIFDVVGRGPVHPFPARMSPGVALSAISSARHPLRVLDPMMGSGTVLAVARAKGHRAIGVDIDPLSILIGKVWTTPLDKALVRKRAVKVLRRAKKDFNHRSLRDAYPWGADDETRRFVRYWFDSYVRRQLTSLAHAIRLCHNRVVRNALWCAYSRLIIAKQAGASRARDLSHSRPHRHFKVAPKKPFSGFLASVEFVLSNCLDHREKRRGPATAIRLGDARSLHIPSNSIDLVLTSPPYLNAIDYMRCSKFSLIWMGKNAAEIRAIRRDGIGTEVGQYEESIGDPIEELIISLGFASNMSRRHKALVRRFIEDMSEVIQETARVLKPRGKAVFVVGENTLRGIYIRNSRIISQLAAQMGLRLEKISTRALPPNRRYLPPPLIRKRPKALHTRMRREVVLTFTKLNRGRKVA